MNKIVLSKGQILLLVPYMQIMRLDSETWLWMVPGQEGIQEGGDLHVVEI